MEFTPNSGQGVITETGFTLSPETNRKLNKLYEKVVFKTLDIRQWKAVFSARREMNKAVTMIAPDSCFGRQSRPWHRER